MSNKTEAQQQEPVEVKQIAEALRQVGLTLVRTNDGFRVMNLGRIEAQQQEPFCYHDGHNIVGKEYADHSDVFPLYTSPNPEQQKPVRFNCTVIDDAHLNGVPLSQWGKQHEMQPCAGRNCGSTNPNLHSAECFEDYEKATGMNQRKTLTNDRVWLEYMQLWPFRPNEEPTLAKDILRFARAIEAKLREKNKHREKNT